MTAPIVWAGRRPGHDHCRALLIAGECNHKCNHCLVIAGVALLAISLLGWWQRLPCNRFAGIRTPATLRSDTAFIAANRVAAPPILAAGVICAAAGGLALGTHRRSTHHDRRSSRCRRLRASAGRWFARPPGGRRDAATGWWLRRVQLPWRGLTAARARAAPRAQARRRSAQTLLLHLP